MVLIVFGSVFLVLGVGCWVLENGGVHQPSSSRVRRFGCENMCAFRFLYNIWLVLIGGPLVAMSFAVGVGRFSCSWPRDHFFSLSLSLMGRRAATV